MEESNEFLKYIYNDDIYLIDKLSINKNEELEENGAPNKNQDQTPIVKEPLPISYFGKNEQGILILVNDPANDLLNQSDLDLLMKIVESGLRYSKNDFALVNTAKFPSYQILDEVEYHYLIAFGIDLSSIFPDQSLYSIQDVDGKKVLFSEDLSVLATDESKKRQLWNSLKSMFNI